MRRLICFLIGHDYTAFSMRCMRCQPRPTDRQDVRLVAKPGGDIR